MKQNLKVLGPSIAFAHFLEQSVIKFAECFTYSICHQFLNLRGPEVSI